MRRTSLTVAGLIVAGAVLLGLFAWQVRVAQRELDNLERLRADTLANLSLLEAEVNQRKASLTRLQAELARIAESDAGPEEMVKARDQVNTTLADLRYQAANTQQKIGIFRDQVNSAPALAGAVATAPPSAGADPTVQPPIAEVPEPSEAADEERQATATDRTGFDWNKDATRVSDGLLFGAVRRYPQVRGVVEAIIALRTGQNGAKAASYAATTSLRKGQYTSQAFAGQVYKLLPEHGGTQLMSPSVSPARALTTLFTDQAAPHAGDVVLYDSGVVMFFLPGYRDNPALVIGMTPAGVQTRPVDFAPHSKVFHAGLVGDCIEHLIQSDSN